MKTTFKIFEKILFCLLVILFSFLLVIQFLNYNDDYSVNTSKFNNYSKFGSFYNEESFEKGVIILKNINPEYKNISILVNGEYIDDFTKDNEIEIHVYNNDIIEIDGTKYNNKLQVKIVGISKNIDSPKLDTIITTSKNIEILGKVQLK